MRRLTTGLVIGGSIAAVCAFIGAAQPQSTAIVPATYSGSVPAEVMLRQPVTTIYPGAIPIDPHIKNPLTGSADAVERGRRDFDEFNCSGCHAPHGGGGMGPSLSNDRWIYRSSDANIYLTIVQGRPNGMPAWGSMLPDRTVWELVSYIHSISHPQEHFGRTISRNPQSPAIEQIPADKLSTTHPWNYSEPFSNGQKPPG